MRGNKWTKLCSLVLICVLLATLLPVQAAAADASELRLKFNNLDTVNNGNWQKDANNDSATLAWGESYVLDAYVTMYEATGDTYYLDKFITHGKGVLAQRDVSRGVSDYRGLKLPAWRNGSYTSNGQYAIFAVHTGMITYPMAKFAAIVAKNPALSGYTADKNLFLKAARDAVAVHADEWVDNGNTGYYKFRNGMPYKQAGMGLPHNQYLAMARTELMIHQATGDTSYLNRARKMFQYFKNNLLIDSSTNGYYWRYSSFYSSSYEDIGHAGIDVEAAFQAYHAGLVFNKDDMLKFAATAAKKMIKPNGSIANNVLGDGATSYYWYIGFWAAYGQFMPVITNTIYTKLSAMSYGGPTGLLAMAMLNKAYADPGYQGGGDTSNPPPVEEPPVDNPPAGELVHNSGFSLGTEGWSGPDVVVKSESGGNKYGSAKYGWNYYQYVTVQSGAKYVLTAKSRKGNAAADARIAYFFYDSAGKQLTSGNVLYKHQGTGWEQMPSQAVTAPSNAARILIKLLVNSGSGTHDFDDVSMRSAGSPLPPVEEPPVEEPPVGEPPIEEPPVDTPPAGELVHNSGFSLGTEGWSGPDVVVKSESDGNKYGSAKYGWNYYQYVTVQPGAKYVLTAKSRKGNAAAHARIAYFFYDSAGKQLTSGNVLYKHQGTGWEQMPSQTVTAPSNAARILIKLLVNSGSGTHDFDDVSMRSAGSPLPPVEPPVEDPPVEEPPVEEPPVDTTPAGELVHNSDFSLGTEGWSGPDVVV
ncbi:MAG: hypothetical protein WCY82_00005, partial [Desulfotomaculaceae bacterium]